MNIPTHDDFCRFAEVAKDNCCHDDLHNGKKFIDFVWDYGVWVVPLEEHSIYLWSWSIIFCNNFSFFYTIADIEIETISQSFIHTHYGRDKAIKSIRSHTGIFSPLNSLKRIITRGIPGRKGLEKLFCVRCYIALYFVTHPVWFLCLCGKGSLNGWVIILINAIFKNKK